MDVLARIKQLVLRRRVRFTVKALDELDRDGLTRQDVYESLVNAQAIYKTLNSTSGARMRAREKLYVIKSFCYSGTLIYSKGKFGQGERRVFYILISSKIETLNE